ncbi:MAG: hypothetical protein FWE10_08010 [Rikenellaceae bacterium]|nr:hypothetical protein [Rikenellaceae bacterium]MCL2693369.1 hypothetical protein [Rikenellaceae bacterium]
MKNGITRQPLGATMMLFSLLLSLFVWRHLAVEKVAVVSGAAPFGSAIGPWFAMRPYAGSAVTVILIFLTALVLTRLISRNLVFPARTYVFLIFFVIAGYGIFATLGSVSVVLATYLAAKASESFASAFRRSARMSKSFQGAMLLGIAPLLHAPAAVYALLVPLAMAVYIRGWRETLVAIVGLALPAATYSYIMWAFGVQAFGAYFTALGESLFTPVSAGGGFPTVSLTSPTEVAVVALVVFMAAAVVLSLGAYVLEARRIRTRALRIYVYMALFMFVGVGGLLLPCASTADVPLLALPLSVVAAGYFSRHTNLAAGILYVLTILAAVAYNLMILKS